jgi:hypothetical protein
MAEAVQICNEFVQVEGSKPYIANIDAEEGQQTETSTGTEMKLLLDTVKELMQTQSQLLKDLAQTTNKPEAPPRRKLECFNCGGSHLRRNCPQLKSQSPETVSQSENSDRPAQ